MEYGSSNGQWSTASNAQFATDRSSNDTNPGIQGRNPFNDDSDFAAYIHLPDPFVSGRPPNTSGMSRSMSSTVIDLTDSPPRSAPSREVIDLDSIPDQYSPPILLDRHVTPTEEVNRQRIRSNARQAFMDPLGQEATRAATEAEAQRARRREWLLQTAQRRTQQRQQQEESGRRDTAPTNVSSGSRSLLQFMPDLIGQGVTRVQAYLHGPNGGGPISLNNITPNHFLNGNISMIGTRFQAPRLDYDIHNGLFPQHHHVAVQPPPPPTLDTGPKYVPPEPVKDPFTRSFTETDTLVCPGCKVELGGGGDDRKRRIFVSKCSHVYCGECGNNIKSGLKRQGIVCHAQGCGKKITKTKIFEAYV